MAKIRIVLNFKLPEIDELRKTMWGLAGIDLENRSANKDEGTVKGDDTEKAMEPVSHEQPDPPKESISTLAG